MALHSNTKVILYNVMSFPDCWFVTTWYCKMNYKVSSLCDAQYGRAPEPSPPKKPRCSSTLHMQGLQVRTATVATTAHNNSLFSIFVTCPYHRHKINAVPLVCVCVCTIFLRNNVTNKVVELYSHVWRKQESKSKKFR